MSSLIEATFDRGINELYGLPDRRVKTLAMGVAHLEPGDRFGETLNRREGVLVLLSGTAAIRGHGFDHGEVATCADCFSQVPVVLYCPPGLYAIKAKKACEVLVIRRDCAKDYQGLGAVVLDPTGFEEEELPQGAGRQRILHTPCDDGSALVVGQTVLAGSGSAVAPVPALATGEGADTEALLYVRLPDGSGSVTGELSGPEGVEEFTLTNRSGVLVPAGHTIQLTAQSPALCLWASGLSHLPAAAAR